MFKRIEEIEVWKRGCRLATRVIDATKGSAMTREWSLRDQLRRSAISVPSNIAEGFERESSVEFKRFLLIAKGSCGELRTQLYISLAAGLMDKVACQPLIDECLELSSMVSGLIRRVKSSRQLKT